MIKAEISRQTTVVTVLEGIRREALLGDFEIERSISETEVALKYQVSRSSVRSAFQILERDGLLVIQPNGRKLLKRVTPKYIEDLCQTRGILECEAARIILKKGICDFSGLLHLVGQFYIVQQKPLGKDRETELAWINEQFHDELFVLTENSALLQCRRTIAPMLSAIVELNASLNPDLNEHGYYESHKKILEMLMEQDQEVIEYLRYHTMVATKNDLLLAMKNIESKSI